MLPVYPTPLVRLGNLFPHTRVYAKCEFLVPSGSFKVRGVKHLLEHLSQENGPRELVVPTTITRAKDEKLQALGVQLAKIAGGGSELLRHATLLAQERGAYFVHPH